MEPRCIVKFEGLLRSKATKRQYRFYLDKFLAHHKLTYSAVMKKPGNKLQEMVIDYIIHLKCRIEAGEISPNTLPPMIFGIRAFMEANDIDINWSRVFRYFPESVKRTGGGKWTTEDIAAMIKVENMNKRAKALILFLASSGCRVGALPGLKIKHLEDFRGCYCVTVYAGTKSEYFTFITPEARAALDDYMQSRKEKGEPVNPDSPVFSTDYKTAAQAASKEVLQYIVNRVLHKAKLRQKTGGYKRYDTQVDTGFRKRFNTVFIDLDLNAHHKERLMGHAVTIPLDNHYHVVDKTKLFETYQKAIPDLMIDQEERRIQELEMKNAAASEQIAELQKKEAEITDLKKTLMVFEDRFKRLEARNT